MSLTRICLLMTAMMLLAAPVHAGGRTWFVSVDGSDENPGTVAEPFRTISRAAEAAGPGDTVRAAAGMYNEAVVFPRSGEEGAPIVFEGERGPGGEWLTILDRSIPAAGWESAPEIGEGVFKAALGFSVGCMTLDGKMIMRINDSHMSREASDLRGWRNLMTMPADEPLLGSDRMPSAVFSTSSNVEEHLFWDGVGILYGNFEGKTYIRFRDGDDPREKELLVAPDGAGFVLRDRAHIVVRDFLVRGAQVCVEISGPEAVGNLIENNRLTHGRARVTVTRGAARNIIRGNEMTLNNYGHASPGAWGTAEPTMATSLAGFVYRSFKYVVGPSSSDDRGIQFSGAGEGNEAVGNRIYDGLIGIAIGQAPGLRVHRNVISGMSSIGILASRTGRHGPLNTEIHDNLVYNCNINLRLHQFNMVPPGERREYYYRNIFHLDEGVGSNIFVHWTGQEMPPGSGYPEVTLYHNTFSGGRRVFSPGIAHRDGGLPNVRFFNNLFSGSQPWYVNVAFYAERDMLDAFDYNWVGGRLHHGIEPEWLGENNVMATGRRMWEPDGMPDFRLPEDSDARGAGLDLSKPFSVQGREFPALPGMEPGYFEGERPDIGAVQYGREVPVPLP